MGYVQKIVTEHMIEKSDMDYAINSMLIFELWMRKHIDEPVDLVSFGWSQPQHHASKQNKTTTYCG